MINVQSTSPYGNNTIDITAINTSDESISELRQFDRKLTFCFSGDRPDPLRFTEILIVICVLLLWCASIFVFIRHSQLLRIRHRDTTYRSSTKAPMNLNHITVVHRTSDMVIHSKPRLTSPAIFRQSANLDDRSMLNIVDDESKKSLVTTSNLHSFDSTTLSPKYRQLNDHLLNPRMISSDVRRRLLDLHRKSMENLAGLRYSISYSTNDVSQCQKRHEQFLTVDVRCVQEAPV